MSSEDNEKLYKKLMFPKFSRKLMLNKPDSVTEFADAELITEPDGERFDMIFDFVFSIAEMLKRIHEVDGNGMLNKNGYLYFAYPKKGNKKYDTYIHRDDILPALAVDDADGIVPGTELKFSKMCALNDTFTIIGLKNIQK